MADGWGAPQEQGWGVAQADGWGPSEDTGEAMPSPWQALYHGLSRAAKEVMQSGETVAGGTPQQEQETAPEAKPLAWGDVLSPYSQLAPKVAYSLGKGAPTVAGGLLGGAAGSMVEPGFGTFAGGAGGAALAAAFQELGPQFAAELKQSPNDPDGAWDRSLEHAAASGIFSGASWAAFPAKFFSGPLKNFAFQALGIQPGLNVAEQATQNLISGQPAGNNLGQAYAQGVAGTAIPAVGHYALSTAVGGLRPVGNDVPHTPELDQTRSALWPSEEQQARIGELNNNIESLKEQIPQLEEASHNYNLPPEQRLNYFEQASSMRVQLHDHETELSTLTLPQDMQEAHQTIDANFPPPPPPVPPEPSRWDSVPFIGQLRAMRDGWKHTFQPEMMSDLALGAQGYFREAISRMAQGKDAVYATYDQFHNWLQKLPIQDQINFMKAAAREDTQGPTPELSGKPPVNIPPELMPAYEQFRKDLDVTGRMDQDVGSKMGWVEDYFPREYKDPERVKEWMLNRINTMGPKAFQKARTFDLLQDALDAGFELKHNNPADAVASRLTAGISFRARTTLVRKLGEIGAAFRVNDDTRGDYIKQGFQVIKDPTGAEWALHPDVQPLWKNVMESKGLWGNEGIGGNVFRGWMGLKNAWVLLKLGLSLFHPLHVSHINLVDGLTRGWQQLKGGDPVSALGSAVKGVLGQFYFAGKPFGVKTEAQRAREAWVTPEWRQTDDQKALVKMMAEGGFSPQLAEELRMGGQRAFRDALAQQEWLKAMPLGLHELLRKSQGLIFEHWIPTLKTAAYLDSAKELFNRRPDLLDNETGRRAALTTIAKSVDNRFGEMFYPNLYWNKTLKDAGIGSFLSLGWNLGFLREFGGGALEPFLKPLIDGTPTRQAIQAAKSKTAFAFLYMTNAMILNAVMTKMMSGQNPDGMDYFLPRIGGNNPDGSPRRISNMFYTREIPMLLKHIQERSSTGVGPKEMISGMGQMLWNKLMFEPLQEIMNNRDYYGYNIMDENAPWYKQTYQLGRYILSDQFSPITITGAKRALQASGKWEENSPNDNWTNFWQHIGHNAESLVTEPEGRLAMAGFGPAPMYASRSAAQNRLYNLYDRYVAPPEKPQAEREVMEERRTARAALFRAQQSGDQQATAAAQQHMADLGMTSKQIRSVKPGTADIYMFKQLGSHPSVQTDFLKGLSAEEFKRYYPSASRKVRADPAIINLARKYYYQ